MMGKKKTIRQSIQKMALQVSIAALVVTIAVGVVSMLNIKKRVISDSARLGESAAENSAGILKEQIESNLLTITESKAEYASSQFGRLAGYVRQYASYLHYLYLNEEQYNPVEVLPPDNKNAGKLVLMRDFANDNIRLPDVKDETGLLGNVEPMFASAMSVDGDIITTIYLGTESGVMISYDKYSDSGESQGNYNFFESSWYTQAKEAETLIFTDTYLDGYGRGETISCAAPFYDAADDFAGVVSMDVLISDINDSVIAMDHVNGAYAFLLDTNGKVIAAPEAFRDTVGNNIVTDDNAKAMQMQSGELDLALRTPKYAQLFAGQDGYTCYDMKTSDYRGILFNFQNEYWTENRDIIPAICYGIDRDAIIQSVLLGEGMPAYGPLQRNIYNNEDIEHYDYNPEKAKEILESVGCTMGEDGFYYRNNEKLGFVISVGAGDQVRVDIAQAAAQQLREIGLDVSVEVPAQVDWGGQMAYLIGWGSPFDADDHTYKVFGTDKGANYSGYSNELVDKYLTEARQSDDPEVRAEAYDKFQEELAKDPAFAFICYIDANYVAKSSIEGIDADTVMGHHGVGIFWNIADWTIAE